MEAVHQLREPSPNMAQEFSSHIAYLVLDTPFAEAARQTYQEELTYQEFTANDFPRGTPLSEREEGYALAVRAGEPQLLGHINEILKNLQEQGRLEALKQQSIRRFAESLRKAGA